MMECLLFLWWNFALYLACYDRTCYLDETLHCNMYMDGTCLCMNNVYGWNLLMDETDVICDMKLMCWIGDMEIYLYMSYIFAVKIVGLKKNRKKETICRLFAICHRRQRALCHQQQTAKRTRGSHLCKLGTLAAYLVILPSASRR